MVAPARGIPIPKRPRPEPSRVNGQPEMIYVEWIDSAGTHGWCAPHDIDACGEPMRCSSCGFLVKETESALVLAQNRSTAHNTGRPWGDLMTIPKVSITLRAPITAHYATSTK